MSNQNKLYLFLFGCIGIRTLLAFSAYKLSPDHLPYLGVFGFFVGLGLIYNYVFDTRLVAPESSGENKRVWWNNFRPIHGVLYLLFAYYAMEKDKNAYVFLAVDVLIALVLFILYKTNRLD